MNPIPHTEQANSVMRFNGHEIMMIDVTPEIASDWLRLNLNNRNPSRSVIEQYKGDIQDNAWPFTGDAICFGSDGILYDGQHRCTAIAESPSGTVVPTLVVTGLSKEAQIAKDQGKKRTPADQLTIHGKSKNANIVAAATKQLLIIENDAMWVDNTAKAPFHTNQRIIEWVDRHPDEHELMTTLAAPAASTLLAPSIVVASGVIASASLGGELAADLVSKLATGASLPAGAPILALRNRAQKYRLEGRKDSDRDVLGLLLRTFEQEVTGHKVSKVQLPRGGTFTKNTFPTKLLNEYLASA